jgi:hypothetical protein
MAEPSHFAAGILYPPVIGAVIEVHAFVFVSGPISDLRLRRRRNDHRLKLDDAGLELDDVLPELDDLRVTLIDEDTVSRRRRMRCRRCRRRHRILLSLLMLPLWRLICHPEPLPG